MPCNVGGGGTSVCFITLPSIPVTALNGTANRIITIDLISARYPQVNFTESFNISIEHYVNKTGYMTAILYDRASAQYADIGPEYHYFCGVYGVCNESIGIAVSDAGQDLALARTYINNSNMSGAYIQAEYASIAISSINASFEAFENRSNNVVNNIVQARYLVNGANISYADSLAMLEKCNQTYASRMYSKINGLSSVTPQEVVNNSYSYYYAANSTESNLTNEIKVCEGLNPSSSSLGQTQLSSKQIASKASAGLPLTYIVLFPAALVVIYGVLKAKDMRETIRIRMAANEHDRKKVAAANGSGDGHPTGHAGSDHHAHSGSGSHAQLPSSAPDQEEGEAKENVFVEPGPEGKDDGSGQGQHSGSA